jgi:hypothetical protein
MNFCAADTLSISSHYVSSLENLGVWMESLL